MTIIKHYRILLTGVPAEHPHPEIPKVPPSPGSQLHVVTL